MTDWNKLNCVLICDLYFIKHWIKFQKEMKSETAINNNPVDNIDLDSDTTTTTTAAAEAVGGRTAIIPDICRSAEPATCSWSHREKIDSWDLDWCGPVLRIRSSLHKFGWPRPNFAHLIQGVLILAKTHTCFTYSHSTWLAAYHEIKMCSRSSNVVINSWP